MKVTIHYRGQLATSAGSDREEREVSPETSLRALITHIAETIGGDFANIVLDSEGRMRRTLLVAIDGEQMLDLDVTINDDVREITLMPPIAGG